jgi:integrase
MNETPENTTPAQTVLDQTRLRSQVTGFRSFEGSIVKVLLRLKALGKAEGTIESTSKRLGTLAKNVDLDDPFKVSLWIANLACADSYKANLVKAYQWYVKVQGLSWEKPKYHWEQKRPRIPTTETLTSIIQRGTKKYRTIFTVLMETGVSPIELSKVTSRDLDPEQNLMNVRGFKGHASRTFKLKTETAAALTWFFKTYEKFPSSDRMSRAWRRLREKASVDDPNVKKIRLYDLRHFYGTMLYHKTKDILYTKTMMGHKKIETTLLYAQLIDFGSSEWTSAVARTVGEACKLIESGFQYVCEFEGAKLFRRPK